MSFPPSVHVMAAGGAHMSAIALVLAARGHRVSGCDARASETLEQLRAAGVNVMLGHSPDHVRRVGMLVHSVAVRASDPELSHARERGIPVWTRARAVRELMEGKSAIAVAGTHGKTTTASLCAFLLTRAGLDPSFLVGGTVRNLGTNARFGAGPHIVVEADEYADAFLEYRPHLAVLLNVEEDHLDYFGDAVRLRASFRQYLASVDPGGAIIACADDPGVTGLMTGGPEGQAFRASVQGFGLRPRATWRAVELRPNGVGGSDFRVLRGGRTYGRFSTRLPGEHNVLNALAGIAVGSAAGLMLPTIREGLREFAGAGRRFEFVGEAAGVTVIDDYAHHPTEVKALLRAARRHLPGRRIVALFQPYTYSRTAYLFERFTRCFEDADLCFLLETDPARESASEAHAWGRSLADLVAAVTSPKPVYLQDFERLREVMPRYLQAGDVLLTVGAGEVKRAGPLVLAALAGQAGSMPA